MNFDHLPTRVVDRAKQRYEELRHDPHAFMARFDLNGDGVLDADEENAALRVLAHEVLGEVDSAKQLAGDALPEDTIVKERYRLLAQIGSGAQGIAYVARDLTDDKLVVVKQLRLSHIDAWDAYDAFRREAEVMSSLRHPRLPQLIEAFHWSDDQNEYYFSVQTLMPGRNLEQRLLSGQLFDEPTLISIATQCLEILSAIHQNDPAILHRDVKPSNILLDDDGTVYLVDFGAVQYARSTKTLAVGTAGYMPPEQMLGKAVPQSDLYGLGATLVRLATRQEPQLLEVSRMRLQWRDHASLSERFSNWIDNLIDPEVEDRYHDAASAMKRLSNLESVHVKYEEPDDPAFSVEPVEITDGKPEGCPIRLWESVDTMICTFPGVGPRKVESGFAQIERMVQRLFSEQDVLTVTGGGFSLDAEKRLRARSREDQRTDRIYAERAGVELTGVYAVTHREREYRYELVGLWSDSDGNRRKQAFFATDQPEWGKWVHSNFRRFAQAHDLKMY